MSSCEGDGVAEEGAEVTEVEVDFEVSNTEGERELTVTLLLTWSLCVNKTAGDDTVVAGNSTAVRSVVVSGVSIGGFWLVGSGRGGVGARGRTLGLLMILLRCPILLREFQGL